MGEVSTRLRSANNINFGPESLYADVECKVKEGILRSAEASISPVVFAQQVVDKVLDSDDTNYIWKGTNAFIVWLLNAIGLRKIFDSIMKTAVGLDDGNLRKRIYERGQLDGPFLDSGDLFGTIGCLGVSGSVRH